MNEPRKVMILGAAGKMGAGISVLLLEELSCRLAQLNGMLALKEFNLYLIDSNAEALVYLKDFLRSQIKKFAERNIHDLRLWFSENVRLIDNEEMIRFFVERAMDLVRLGTIPELGKDSDSIFEAIIEDEQAKVDLIKRCEQFVENRPYYFSNTSSIPIHVLAEKGGVEGRIIGFHFYNPPQVQKLLEIIVPQKIESDLQVQAEQLAEKLKKTVVFSEDVAGFIGNGYFMREIAFAFTALKSLTGVSLTEGILLINEVTQTLLLRPMGIFQLMDYVGLDVYQKISSIMTKYISDESFPQNIIQRLMEQQIYGGQFADGTQKNGFFSYNKNKIEGIFDFERKLYRPIEELMKLKEVLGTVPEGCTPWKILSKDPQRSTKVSCYLSNLWNTSGFGSNLAKGFLIETRRIGNLLIDQKVAHNIEDVNTVLQCGFYHLYGVQEGPL